MASSQRALNHPYKSESSLGLIIVFVIAVAYFNFPTMGRGHIILVDTAIQYRFVIVKRSTPEYSTGIVENSGGKK